MLIPDKFAEASVTELVEAAALGHVGLDRRWLDAILAHGDAAVPELVSFGLEDRPEDAVNLDEALVLLFRHFRSPAALPFFIEYTRRNADVPDEFVPAIREMGEPALEELLKVHAEMEEDQAGDIAFCLAALRIPDERVLQILVDLLEYDLTEGAIALGLYGDESARPALERVMEQEEDAHLKGLLHDAIGQLGRGPDEHEPFDINSYFDDRVLPPTEALAEPDLLDMLECSDAEYRFAAAAGFIQSEPGDEAVDKLLEHAKGDPEPRVRAKCWEALAEFAEDDEIYDAMLECLQNESAPMIERAGALIGLGQMAGEEPIRDFAEAFYEEDETRAAAMAAMWNSLDKSFAAFFPGHLDDPDPDIRKQAISGVGYLGIVDAAETLRPMFEDEEYRPNALFSYALCARTEVSPARMRSLLRRIDEFAGGLDEDEQHLVELALDERLMLNGHKPVFHPEGGTEPVHAHEHETPPAPAPKVGRNDPCPCGSGKKYKKCHGG